MICMYQWPCAPSRVLIDMATLLHTSPCLSVPSAKHSPQAQQACPMPLLKSLNLRRPVANAQAAEGTRKHNANSMNYSWPRRRRSQLKSGALCACPHIMIPSAKALCPFDHSARVLCPRSPSATEEWTSVCRSKGPQHLAGPCLTSLHRCSFA